MSEKCISEVTLRITETLKRDLQDIAMHEDRSLSDVIRIALEIYLYGYKHRTDEACARRSTCRAMNDKP